MGAFNQLNGAIFDAGAIEARLSAIDGKSIYNQRDGGILDMDSLARRLTALDGKVAVMQGGIEFDVDTFMRRLAAIEAGLFTPLQLFANGEQGGWYDASDFSAMFQDSAGTTPVTATGQPVGKILDKSGRGNHLTQATSTSRPTVQQDGGGYYYWNVDGIDDCWSSANIAFTSAQMTVFAGVRKLSDAAAGILAEISAAPGSNNGTFGLFAPGSVAANYWGEVRGSALIADNAFTTFAAPISSVLTFEADVTAATVALASKLRVNGAAQVGAPTGSAPGGTTFGTYPLFVGARNLSSVFFTGRIYQLVVRGALSSAAQIAAAETFVGARMGIAL